MDKKRITYVIIPFFVMFFWLFVTYWLNQVYAEENGIVGIDYSYILQGFNDAVPFVSWSVYPYVIAYPFWIWAFFYLGYRSKKHLYEILALCLVTFTVCGIWYLIQQSDVQVWRETSGLFGQTELNFTESLMMTIYNAAGPRNALPSMHCLMCWISICGVREDKSMPKLMKGIIVFLAVAIMISTQTTKQHYIIDTIAAVAICELAFQVLKRTKVPLVLENFFSKINQKIGIDWNVKA